ncbi:MAG: peptidoglycan DD-metalloendopeptidase family protein [Acidimicrobiia bacterium]
MRKLTLLAVVSMMVVLLLPVATPVIAASSAEQKLSDLQSQISDLNGQIKAQKGERTSIQQDLATAQERLAAVSAELAGAESKVQEVEATISSTEDHLAQVQREVDALEGQIADTRVSIRETSDQLSDQAIEMYMGGVPELQSVVFTAGDMTAVAVGVNYAKEIVASSELLINDLATLEAVEARQKEAVEERKASVQSDLTALGQQRQQLEADRVEVEIRSQEAEAEAGRQQQLLNKVNSQISNFEGELSALEKDQAQIKAQIAAAQQKGGTKPSVLLWPVNGRITSPFGWRVHPIFGTKKLHTGIDIGVSYGTPIKAAAAGTVILAQTYGGYGNATAIDHGGGMSTLYGHQSKIIVKVGQKVAMGQVIGYVGCTGYCTGPHLHFEVRENGNPVDPTKYLP